MTDRAMTPKQALAYANSLLLEGAPRISLSAIYYAVEHNKLRCTRLGKAEGRILVSQSAVRDWLGLSVSEDSTHSRMALHEAEK